ncbi:MAG: GNAT family N-acetyltransferase [Clostridia bacterium]|nr:GNAT family N-acetyltransferase [Clostridia bacterium]
MAEIVYQFSRKQVGKRSSNIRWITVNDLTLFNKHLSLCTQKSLEQSSWDEIYKEGTMYCLLFENKIPVARACVEKYSSEAWEIADVRVVRSFRNRGFAYEVCSYVLRYILDNSKNATIRTETDNYPMQRLIEKLGFVPLESERSVMFSGVRYVPIADLGLSQIYLNDDKLTRIKQWFNPNDITGFQPLPVYDFGNGKLTLTDGHSRAFVAYKTGLCELPVIYDTDEIVTSKTGQMLYKNDIIWCERFDLKSICDLEKRIVSNEEYEIQWIDRCNKAYNLLTKTDEQQRANWQRMHSELYLYGASEDLKSLFFEDIHGNSFSFSTAS